MVSLRYSQCFVCAVALACLGWLSTAECTALADEAQILRLEKQFNTSVQPLLVKYCYDCHSGDSPDGEVRLDVDHEPHKIATTARRRWQKVRGHVHGHLMPPKDSEQPTDQERKLIAEWITETIDSHDCTGPIDPGHEVIRRLTRTEYKNTIRDLLGIEVTLADEFPMDDVGYGFDNIGDVLTLSPLLMEKYLAAAEAVAAEAIVTNELDARRKLVLPASEMHTKGGSDVRGGGWRWLTSSGHFNGSLEVAIPGEYLIRVDAYGDQAGDEPAKMLLNLNGKDLTIFDVAAESDKPGTYEFRTNLKPGRQELLVAFTNDFYNPRGANGKKQDRNLAVRQIELVGPVNSDGGLDYPEAHRRVVFVRPSDEIKEADAASKVLQRLASKAFRRPLTKDEGERLMNLYRTGAEAGGNFESGIQMALTGVLASPSFLFKVELDPAKDDADGIRELNEYELASRLSYFLWSSMPDDELFRLAAEGKLRQQLEGQVRRMLADPKASALVDSFAMQWLQLRALDEMEPDRRRFSNWNDSLRDDMLTETKLFVGAIIREDRSVLDLLAGDFTFLNQRLAKHYGIEGISGDRFQRVALGNQPRGGVLTQASVLTVTSNPTRTSPVKRGKWVLENLLNSAPPDPPADVPELTETPQAEKSASLRERLEIHRADARCAACHQQMDPLGFALENFDAVGRWRDRDGKFEIDAAGVLPGGKPFTGPAELKQVLVAERGEEFLRCLSEKLLTYALGRGVEYFDQCTIDEMVEATKQDQHRFSRLVLEIAKSDAFQKRRAKK